MTHNKKQLYYDIIFLCDLNQVMLTLNCNIVK